MSLDDDLLKKAESGDCEAQCRLAVLFELGMDRDIDLDKALSWWLMAAEQGSTWAMRRLGDLCDAGLVPGGEAKAREWREKVREAERSEAIQSQKHETEPPLEVSRGNLSLGIKVLVVEDEEPLRMFLRVVFEKLGMTVIEAGNGKEAMSCLGEHPNIALIFTDLKMPIMNGIQFIKSMRALRAAEGVPVVVMTAHTTPELIGTVKELGISAWLMKPSSKDKIVETVEGLVAINQIKAS